MARGQCDQFNKGESQNDHARNQELKNKRNDSVYPKKSRRKSC